MGLNFKIPLKQNQKIATSYVALWLHRIQSPFKGPKPTETGVEGFGTGTTTPGEMPHHLPETNGMAVLNHPVAKTTHLPSTMQQMPVTEEEEEAPPLEEEVRSFLSYPKDLFNQPLGTLINPLVLSILPPRNLPTRKVVNFAGSIKFHLNQWSILTSDRFILDLVQGWTIPFLDQPVQVKEPRQYKMQKRERLQLSIEIQNMLRKQVIQEVPPAEGQFLSQIFIKEKRDLGKYRPIINFKALNEHVPYEKFKMESLSDVKDLINQNDLMVKLDLKDAFLSVPLKQKNSGKFARFKWEGKLYQCLTLMFGLGPAPRLFTKLLKVPMSLLRRIQIRIVIYIDDMILMAQQLSEILMARDTTIYLLQALGFTMNFEKSILQPSRTLEFLGVLIDSANLTFSIPQGKINSLKALCTKLLQRESTTVRELAKAMGRLRATAPAFSPAPLQLRNMQLLMKLALRKNNSYEQKIILDKGTKQELTWWLENLEIFNGKAITMKSPDIIISSDASPKGWGAACKGSRTGGKWSQKEQDLQLNEQELLAAQRAILTFLRIHNPSSIHMQVDNQVALSYLLKMGGKTNQFMNSITKEIWDYLLKNKITMTGEWIPSELNTEADQESRSNDPSEWKLNTRVFNQICQIMGQPELDLFASLACHQLNKYISWKPDPMSAGVDALSISWTHKFLYAFPPFKLIGKTLKKIQYHHTSGIMITPAWHTATWYPTLLNMTIKRPLLLPQIPNLLLDPAGNQHPLIMTGGFRLAAWLVSGQSSKQKAFLSELPKLSPLQEEKEHQRITSQPGRNLLAGVLKGKRIQFTAL